MHNELVNDNSTCRLIPANYVQVISRRSSQAGTNDALDQSSSEAKLSSTDSDKDGKEDEQ